MPPALPLIGALAAGLGSIIGGTLGIILTIVGFGLQFIGSFLNKPEGPKLPDRQISRTLREPTVARRLVYGEKRVGGVLAFMGTTSDGKFLHMVIAVAAHEIEGFEAVLLDDYPIYPDDLNGSGEVTRGRYDNLVRVKTHLGTDGQTVDTDLDSEVSEITSDFRLRGVAYLYIRLEHDADVFPTQIPNVSAYIRGKKVTDTRSSTTIYSQNSALAVRDYLVTTTTDGGAGFDTSEVDDTFVTTAANVCDEFVAVQDVGVTVKSVDSTDDFLAFNDKILKFQTGDRVQVTTTGTLPGGIAAVTDYYVIVRHRVGSDDHDTEIKLATSYLNAVAGTQINITSVGSGTHTVTKKAEPRYVAAGVIDTAQKPSQHIRELLSSMAGQMAAPGGVFKMWAGAWVAPTVTLDESDLRGPIKFQTKQSRRVRFNAVKGVYSSPLNIDVPADFPAVTNLTYETEDGERLWGELDLAYTVRPHQAQRIGKIALERMRQQIAGEIPVSLVGMLFQPGDTVNLTIDKYGWSAKTFEIVNWRFDSQKDDAGTPVLGILLSVRETAAAIFDWNSGEETSVDPAPDTNLPNPFVVANPTGLAVTTLEFLTETGTRLYKLDLTWTAPLDGFVTNGGQIEIQFKKSADADFLPSFFVDGSVEMVTIPADVQFGVNYDVQIRSVNSLGARRRPTAWTQIFGYTVGAPGAGAVAQFDDGLIVDQAVSFVEMGSIGATVELDLDDGSIV